MIRNVNGPPGIGTTLQLTPMLPFLDNDRGAEFLDGGRYSSIYSRDWNNPTLQTLLSLGLMMGKITAAAGLVPSGDIGKYAPTLLGIVTGNLSTSGTSLAVSAAQAVAIAARVGNTGTNTLSIVGPPSAAGTIAQQTITFSAINTTTGAITISATGVAYVAGSAVVAVDGSQNPNCILGGADYGVNTIGVDNNPVSAQLPRLYLAGQVISSRIIGLMSLDTSVITYFKNKLNANGRHYIFNDEY